MKKLVIFMVVISLVVFNGAVLAQTSGNFETKLRLDIGGNLDLSYNNVSVDDDVETGFTLIGEYKVPTNSQWTLGAGMAYQLDRSVDNSGAEDFNFIPLYGLAQYNLAENPVYLLGHLGYNLFDADWGDDIDYNGGLYYGFGAGVNFGENNNYVAEALYSVNNGEIEDDSGDTADVEYSKFTISLGMKF